ncbi:MAG TPA: alpha/beta hydrolase [Acidimicrobiales bacterium]|nr:alpha/beta hydrolase [Acidimicrobiales bacterium]
MNRSASSDETWRTAGRLPLRTLAAGDGPPVVLFHGFAMRPEIYAGTARRIAACGRSVICPDLFSLPGEWHAESVASAVADTMDRMSVGRAIMIAHSFGGGIQLDLAVDRPELVESLVFADTLAVSRELRLAREAVHPITLFRLATPPALYSFGRTALTRPGRMARAAWWGFTSDRNGRAAVIAERRIPSHVIWAERDTLLPRSEGSAFARELGGDFHLLCSPDGRGPVDHDAMFRHPDLFVRKLGDIGVLDRRP